ncbi:MAG: hypothetical protein HFI75_03950 [Lachnospiraceae bacterium]|nr:hypothetical protein [Lachnospiraceae bacterium]
MIMEHLLKYLFDYQRFQPNLRLSALIVDTEKRYGQMVSQKSTGNRAAKAEEKGAGISAGLHNKDREIPELSEEELERVNAAGELPIPVRLEDHQDD